MKFSKEVSWLLLRSRLVSLSAPMMLPEKNWCSEGGGDVVMNHPHHLMYIFNPTTNRVISIKLSLDFKGFIGFKLF